MFCVPWLQTSFEIEQLEDYKTSTNSTSHLLPLRRGDRLCLLSRRVPSPARHMAAAMASKLVLLPLCLTLAALGAANGKTVISLGSQTWTVENGNRSISASTTLPAYPLEILREQGIVEDPLYRCEGANVGCEAAAPWQHLASEQYITVQHQEQALTAPPAPTGPNSVNHNPCSGLNLSYALINRPTASCLALRLVCTCCSL
jgi:hypothetical protein